MIKRRYAVILAGGDGTRMRSLTTALTGQPVPKQFCRLIGRRTLIDETDARLDTVVSRSRRRVLVSKPHRQFYEDLPSHGHTLIEQPSNRGTSIGIAAALAQIDRLDPLAVVGFFPSDHYYSNVGAFRQTISIAYHVASLRIDALVLVGAGSTRAEPEYGWIEPGRPVSWPANDGRVFEVSQFWEKPGPELARRLHRRRCYWSTFTTIGTVHAFRSALMLAGTDLDALVTDLMSTSGPIDAARLDASYRDHAPVCFSSGVLAHVADQCLVVPLVGTAWSDIGSPERLAQVTASALSA